MLKSIKSMILEKQEYLEAAQIIFEDAAHGGIDDLIILNESAEVPEDDEKEIDPDHDGDGDLGKGDDDGKKQDDEEEGDINNIPIDDGKEPLEDGDNPDKGSEVEGDDLLSASIDDEAIGAGTLSPGDDLPPVNDGIDDFLNVSIDLRSNTITDVLPVPPDNAGEAISDDILSTRIDSGFSEGVDILFSEGTKIDKFLDKVKVLWNKFISFITRKMRELKKGSKETYTINSTLTIKEIIKISHDLQPSAAYYESNGSKLKSILDKVEIMFNRKDAIKISLTQAEVDSIGDSLSKLIINTLAASDSFKDDKMTPEIEKQLNRWIAMLTKFSNTLTDITQQLRKSSEKKDDEPINESADDLLSTDIGSIFQEEAEPEGVQPGGFPMDEGVDDLLNTPMAEGFRSFGNPERNIENFKNKETGAKFANSPLGKQSSERSEKIKKSGKKDLPVEYYDQPIGKGIKSKKEWLVKNGYDPDEYFLESTDDDYSFFEAITLDGGSEEKPADGTADGGTAADPGDPPAEEGGENEVTAAVKDKVAEADAPIDDAAGGTVTGGKEALLKKLGSLTKGLEDAKKAVMDTIQ